jgi:small-conductance mechanosensitive channel
MAIIAEKISRPTSVADEVYAMGEQIYKWAFASKEWLDKGAREEWLLTIIGAALAACIYTFVISRVKRSSDTPEQKRLSLARTRNALWGFGMLWVVMVWSKMLFPFLFSIVAVLVAVVIMTKEWTACWFGTLYRMATKIYKIGDHISINNVRGEVVDIQWMQTKVLELGPAPNGTYYTGNTLEFPNSWLLSHPVKNETCFNHYGFHWIHVPCTVKDDIVLLEAILVQEANKVCEPFLDLATKDLARVQRNHLMETPSVKPKIHLEFTEPGILKMHLRFPAPKGRNNELAQAILMGFLAQYTPSIQDKWQRGVQQKMSTVAPSAGAASHVTPST